MRSPARSTSTITRSPSKSIECEIADRAIALGWVKPEPASERPAKRSRSSAPARRAWPAPSSSRAPATTVHVYREDAKAGGLMRYGIPDFKMEKHHVDRRVAQMQAEGVVSLRRPCRRRRRPRKNCSQEYDAVVLTGGSEKARDLPFPDASSRASISPWTSCRNKTAGSAAKPAVRRRRSCRGQARRRHRRRRHRLRLHRHLDPPGRGVGDQFRDHAATAVAREQDADLAELAAEAAHLVEPRGGRRARLRRETALLFRRQRSVKKLHCVHVDEKLRAASRQRIRDRRRARPAGDGFCAPGPRGHDQEPQPRARPARQRQCLHEDYRTSVDKVFAAGDMRRGQSLGAGHPRGPAGGPRGRQVSDGFFAAAAVIIAPPRDRSAKAAVAARHRGPGARAAALRVRSLAARPAQQARAWPR